MRKFRTCPFNAQHVVPLEEYQNHVKTCEGRVRRVHCVIGCGGGNKITWLLYKQLAEKGLVEPSATHLYNN